VNNPRMVLAMPEVILKNLPFLLAGLVSAGISLAVGWFAGKRIALIVAINKKIGVLPRSDRLLMFEQ